MTNPAPLPGLHTDRSFQHRKNVERDFPGPHTPFEQMREDGFIVCGDPDYVTRWLENDMKIACYGHFLGMFHVGNLPHEKVMTSKRLFAERVMPLLRSLNIDTRPAVQTTTPTIETSRPAGLTGGRLPLYGDFNYTITRDSPEVIREFVTANNGKLVAGWEMHTPEREAGGFPCQIIFAGPTADYRGSAIRLSLRRQDGSDLSGDADVLIEIADERGADRQTVFQGKYRDFAQIPDQHAPGVAIAAQQRAVANDRYVIRLVVTLDSGDSAPDPAAASSFFELECFKHWINVTA